MNDGANAISLEARMLEEFPQGVTGAGECRRIICDWFDRAEQKNSQGSRVDDDAVEDMIFVLRNIQEDMLSMYPENNKSFLMDNRIWSWPDNSLFSTSDKDNSDKLNSSLAEYTKRPWLHHNLIDASAINAILFTRLVYFSYYKRSGLLTGFHNWGVILFGGNFLAQMALDLLIPPIRFFLRWLMLPLVAWALVSFGFERQAIIALSIWALYLLFRFLRTPARWRKRKAAQKIEDLAGKYYEALFNAWSASRGPVVNPSRLRELILIAEGYGTVLPPILHTIIDRAIQRDPTALLTD
jgi:hypothetical protein